MPTIHFTTVTGTTAKMQTTVSERMGEGLRAIDSFMIGTVFKPATAADRDALVEALLALDYTTNNVEVVLEHGDRGGDGLYRIRATMTVTGDQLDAWIAREKKAMAERLGLKDSSKIRVTVTNV